MTPSAGARKQRAECRNQADARDHELDKGSSAALTPGFRIALETP